jgi:hypothetical protein
LTRLISDRRFLLMLASQFTSRSRADFRGCGDFLGDCRDDDMKVF